MQLKFNKNGKFRIMQIADIQDTQLTSKDTISFISAALDKDKPDLVVFTGDQLKGYGFNLLLGDRYKNAKQAITNFVRPVVQRNIPFTFVFGNHDAQGFGIDKEEQLKIYQSFDSCLTDAGDKTLPGVANHNLTVKDSKGEKVVFNLYFIDSLSMTVDGKCAAVTPEQIEWYKNKRDALKDANGGEYVKSLVFQHIPLCEMWELFKEVPKSKKPHATGYRNRYGKYYWINDEYLIKGNCDFTLETPSVPEENLGEFEALKEKGDIIGIFFGHDHNNSFVGKYNGLVMGYTQGCGFNVYGPKMDRGVRIIDLDENDLSTFSTYTTLYKDLFTFKEIKNKPKFLLYSYAPPSFESVVPKLKKTAAVLGVSLAVTGVTLALKHKMKK